MRRWAVVLLLCAFAGGSPAVAENYAHPGLVFAGKDGWLTPAVATAKGYVRYQRRWLPSRLAPKLAAWEAEDKKRNGWKDAYKAESLHYRIVTDVPRFVLELEIVPFLDALYDTFTRVFKEDLGLTGKGANKKTITIYGSAEEYGREEAEGCESKPRDTPGFFQADELVLFYEDTDPGEFYATAFHEGTHQFVAGLLPGAKLPVWLDEGIAVYFEGCTYSRATQRIVVDHFPPDRVEEAQDALREVQVSDDSSAAERLFMDVPKEQFGSTQYALAWSFLHFLVNGNGGKNREAFARFLRATNGSGTKPIARVFEETTKLRLTDIERSWRDAVLSWKKPPEPTWLKVVVEGEEGPDAGILSGDRLFSLDGVEVGDAAAFASLWPQRAKDRPTEMVVVRRTPVEGNAQYRDEFVTLSVPPDLKRVISVTPGDPRVFNLKD